jgi:uncharacterized SAM-binding protein YcdF (DUF218 family)
MGMIKKIVSCGMAFLKWFLWISGICLIVFIIFSFTDLPYFAYHRLGTANAELTAKPDYIVVLGGSGMPSPEGLIRTYYAAIAANKYKEAKIIIALPDDKEDSMRQLRLMAEELMVKGIDSSRIAYEPDGFNTHAQAVNIARITDIEAKNKTVMLITSPEHMYRSVGTFRKAGFSKVEGIAAFEKPVDEYLISDKEKTKEIRVRSLAIRYNMWSYMNYELLVLREYFAIIYYKLKGWI